MNELITLPLWKPAAIPCCCVYLKIQRKNTNFLVINTEIYVYVPYDKVLIYKYDLPHKILIQKNTHTYVILNLYEIVSNNIF